MKTITKGLVGTVAAGAMALASASPALARDRDGISTGEVIAGALIIGGIAAVAAAASDNDRGRGDYDRGDYGRDYDYDRGGYRGNDGRGGYNNGGNSRQAVERCVSAAESQASRYSYGGRADVTDIRSISNNRNGLVVKGRIAVNSRGQAWQRGQSRYGNGWNNDYRGWNQNLAGYDSGSFTCTVRNGRVNVDFNGIRGLR